MTDIKELLTEYSSLTGRPLATITVSEYLEIKRFSETGMSAPIITQLERAPAPQEEIAEKIKPQIEPVSEPHEIKAVKKDVPREQSEKKPISSAFMMMRSIGG